MKIHRHALSRALYVFEKICRGKSLALFISKSAIDNFLEVSRYIQKSYLPKYVLLPTASYSVFFRKILHDQSTVLSKYHKLISDGFVQVCPFYLNCIHIFWSLIDYQELLGSLWLKANCPPSECFIWTLSKINRNSIMKKKNETFANFIFAISKTGKAMYIISDWNSSSSSLGQDCVLLPAKISSDVSKIMQLRYVASTSDIYFWIWLFAFR